MNYVILTHFTMHFAYLFIIYPLVAIPMKLMQLNFALCFMSRDSLNRNCDQTELYKVIFPRKIGHYVKLFFQLQIFHKFQGSYIPEKNAFSACYRKFQYI